MARWTAFPHDAAGFRHDAKSLKRLWPKLHAGDAEPWPQSDAVVAAWIEFHAGEFRRAVDAGLAAGGAGVTAANKAQSIYAHYLERKLDRKLALFLAVAERAEAQQRAEPKNPNAFYWQAYALGRYAQGISVVKALAQGLGARVKGALARTIALAPKHADAHIALGSFHAEVIEKVGRLVGRFEGADADSGLAMYDRALKLDPGSVIGLVEKARGIVLIDGGKRRAEAAKLLSRAAACEPLDAMQRLDVEAAREALAG